ncbi:MAG: four helix bundle suffix domain-containing protein [Verrucomicrobiales bacterium]
MPPPPHGFLPPHGGYEQLLSYQKALIVFDGTIYFTRRWLPARGDRTVDQMVQAARSGKQNIVEGSAAAGTSKEMELKLTNVALASLRELQEDYQDFLRSKRLPPWPSSHPRVHRLREMNRTPTACYDTFRADIESDDPEVSANTLLGLVKVTCYLLQRQVQSLEQSFLKHGGLRERMTHARLEVRKKQQRDGEA